MLIAWIAALLPWAVAQESAFIRPVYEGHSVEYYDLGDLRYGIFLDKVVFQEAKQTCINNKGRLVEFLDSSTAEFIARALAESAVGFSTPWVGGRYTPATPTQKGVWRWLSGANITTGPQGNKRYPMEELPYWVTKPDEALNETACLVMDRNNHHRPLIAGLTCDVRRPYICQLVQTDEATKPSEVPPPILVANKTFHLFRARYTWTEALTFCRAQGLELAVVTEPDEFVQIQSIMRRVRPIIENAWTSGAVVNGRWIWVATNQEIPTFGLGHAPWHRPEDIIMDGCLLADRHVCDYFVYLEAKCDRRRNVLCQHYVEPEPKMFQPIKGSNLFVSTVRLSWHEARKKCEECLEGGAMLQLAGHNSTQLGQQIKWLFTAMNDVLGSEIRHLWLNGLLKDDEFKWQTDPSGQTPGTYNYTVDPVRFSNLSSSALAGSGYIIYCPGNFQTEPYLRQYECLNLDRENLKHFFMYGLACKYRQHFICEANSDKISAEMLLPACRETNSPSVVTSTATDMKHTAVTTRTTTTKHSTTTRSTTTTKPKTRAYGNRYDTTTSPKPLTSKKQARRTTERKRNGRRPVGGLT